MCLFFIVIRVKTLLTAARYSIHFCLHNLNEANMEDTIPYAITVINGTQDPIITWVECPDIFRKRRCGIPPGGQVIFRGSMNTDKMNITA